MRVVERHEDGAGIRGPKLHRSAASPGHGRLAVPTRAMEPGREELGGARALGLRSAGRDAPLAAVSF